MIVHKKIKTIILKANLLHLFEAYVVFCLFLPICFCLKGNIVQKLRVGFSFSSFVTTQGKGVTLTIRPLFSSKSDRKEPLLVPSTYSQIDT